MIVTFFYFLLWLMLSIALSFLVTIYIQLAWACPQLRENNAQPNQVGIMGTCFEFGADPSKQWLCVTHKPIFLPLTLSLPSLHHRALPPRSLVPKHWVWGYSPLDTQWVSGISAGFFFPRVGESKNFLHDDNNNYVILVLTISHSKLNFGGGGEGEEFRGKSQAPRPSPLY